ncbi:hypothetical protein GCM10009772_05100 [Pseudonocardia alni subsp. carboxydivorans]
MPGPLAASDNYNGTCHPIGTVRRGTLVRRERGECPINGVTGFDGWRRGRYDLGR